MSRLLRAGERFRSGVGGVESWHCFSAGGHYDPDNVGFGALVGCDEHVAVPGGGFDWHRHRGVTIVSWLLAGALRHEDDGGVVRVVGPGEVLVQATGAGVRHRETNASVDVPLRFVQLTLVGGDGPAVSGGAPPLDLGAARFEVWHRSGSTPSGWWHLFVTSGAWQLDAGELRPGDSVRGTAETVVTGAGELLLLTLA